MKDQLNFINNYIILTKMKNFKISVPSLFIGFIVSVLLFFLLSFNTTTSMQSSTRITTLGPWQAYTLTVGFSQYIVVGNSQTVAVVRHK